MVRRVSSRGSKTAARALEMPQFIEPMLAQAVEVLPSGPEWGLEPKIDGHRTEILKDGTSIDIRTRNNKKPLVDVRQITAAAVKVQAEQAIIDGELTALDERGLPSFQALQNRDISHGIAFWAFDLLFVDGRDLRSEPLSARQARLAQIIEGSGLRLCVALPGEAAAIIHAVKSMGLEGIVAKRIESAYRAGDRSDDWQKKRFDRQQEFVIGGYRPDGDKVDNLLVGVYDGGKLKFAAKIRKGLNRWNRVELRRQLEPLAVSRCPFVDLPTSEKPRRKSAWDSGGVSADEMKEIQFVQPRLIAQVDFVEWTSGGFLRHPAFIALRADKSAKDVVREK